MDQAPTAGWPGLKMVRYDGFPESLNWCRLLRACDSLRRRLPKRGRSHGGAGVSKTPPSFSTCPVKGAKVELFNWV